ncbi:MAG: hypothetical protein NE330_22340, partial [Lentisphaeraceae bacterium]|nr:hypothetical protein [Lentisphaeraceae bacterium]
KECHPFFNHRNNIIIDGLQQLFCKFELKNTPEFKVEVETNPFYKHLHNYWFYYQAPLGILFYHLGGLNLILTGIFLRLFLSQFGHWLVAYFLHNHGNMPNKDKKAGTQGYNIPILALLTFGEAYHNNHHRCPNAAKNSFFKGEIDPAWWLIKLLQKLQLANKIKLYERNT